MCHNGVNRVPPSKCTRESPWRQKDGSVSIATWRSHWLWLSVFRLPPCNGILCVQIACSGSSGPLGSWVSLRRARAAPIAVMPSQPVRSAAAVPQSSIVFVLEKRPLLLLGIRSTRASPALARCQIHPPVLRPRIWSRISSGMTHGGSRTKSPTRSTHKHA
jgi:hypothetical protein